MREEEDFRTYYLVIARDTDLNGKVRCIRCGALADDVHEIFPRSHFGPQRRKELFDIRNRVCLCRKCHSAVHNNVGRGELLHRLKTLYGYEYHGEAKCTLDSYTENLSSHTSR